VAIVIGFANAGHLGSAFDGFMNNYLKWLVSNRTGLGLTMMVLLFIGGWRFYPFA
jgi:hypothetical protein